MKTKMHQSPSTPRGHNRTFTYVRLKQPLRPNPSRQCVQPDVGVVPRHQKVSMYRRKQPCRHQKPCDQCGKLEEFFWGASCHPKNTCVPTLVRHNRKASFLQSQLVSFICGGSSPPQGTPCVTQSSICRSHHSLSAARGISVCYFCTRCCMHPHLCNTMPQRRRLLLCPTTCTTTFYECLHVLYYSIRCILSIALCPKHVVQD